MCWMRLNWDFSAILLFRFEAETTFHVAGGQKSCQTLLYNVHTSSDAVCLSQLCHNYTCYWLNIFMHYTFDCSLQVTEYQ